MTCTTSGSNEEKRFGIDLTEDHLLY